MLTSYEQEKFKFNPAASSFVNGNLNTSRLLCLPGEIRNQIYAYVFTVGIYKFIKGDYPQYSLGNPFDPRPPPEYKVYGLALTLICKGIYYEVRSLPYNLNILDFSDMLYTLGPSYSYTAGEYMQLVKRLPNSDIVIVFVINSRRITPMGFPRGPGTTRPWCI